MVDFLFFLFYSIYLLYPFMLLYLLFKEIFRYKTGESPSAHLSLSHREHVLPQPYEYPGVQDSFILCDELFLKG